MAQVKYVNENDLVLLCSRFPTIASTLQDELRKWNATAVLPGNLPWDPKADPSFWDHTWTNFGDYLNVLANNVS